MQYVQHLTVWNVNKSKYNWKHGEYTFAYCCGEKWKKLCKSDLALFGAPWITNIQLAIHSTYEMEHDQQFVQTCLDMRAYIKLKLALRWSRKKLEEEEEEEAAEARTE